MLQYIFIYFTTYGICLVGNYFYNQVCVHKDNIKNLNILYIFQAMVMLMCPYLKGRYPLESTLLLMFSIYIPLFAYEYPFKEKFKYYIVFYSLIMSAELFLSFFISFFGSLITGSTSFLLEEYQNGKVVYTIILMILNVLNDALVVSFFLKIIKKYQILQNAKLLILFALPITLFGVDATILYGNIGNDSAIFIVIYWFIFLVSLFIVIKFLKVLKKEHDIYVINVKKKEILNMQIDEINEMNEFYKKIRKRNHDFQNHGLIVEQLLKNKDDKAFDYIRSLLKICEEDQL